MGLYYIAYSHENHAWRESDLFQNKSITPDSLLTGFCGKQCKNIIDENYTICVRLVGLHAMATTKHLTRV